MDGVIKRATATHWQAPKHFPRGKHYPPYTLVFTCSMSDFWHESVPPEWQDEALDVIEATAARGNIYQILTKRPAMALRRLALLKRRLPPNVWAGATVGHPKSLPLLKPLRRIEATKHFLSVEPLLAPMIPGLDLTDIDQVIGGGESPSRPPGATL